MPLNYKIDVLQALRDKGYTSAKLRKDKLLAEGVIQSLRDAKPISWANISRLIPCDKSVQLANVFKREWIVYGVQEITPRITHIEYGLYVVKLHIWHVYAV